MSHQTALNSSPVGEAKSKKALHMGRNAKLHLSSPDLKAMHAKPQWMYQDVVFELVIDTVSITAAVVGGSCHLVGSMQR